MIVTFGFYAHYYASNVSDFLDCNKIGEVNMYLSVFYISL